MKIYIDKTLYEINDSDSIGKGGEADVYKFSGKYAVKIFKPPSHPDLANNKMEQQAAIRRLIEHQTKLKKFPSGISQRVTSPLKLCSDKAGKVLGYVMHFKKGDILYHYSDRKFSEQATTKEGIIKIFQDMHSTIIDIHNKNVVVGDFNDLNILINNKEAYFIDADSYQYDKFFCHVFTETFVDPLLCDKREKRPILTNPYNNDSDWYAYNVMLMRCLLFAGPYSGVYKPKNKKDRIPQTQRPLKRITVFNNEVKYPKPAIPLSTLNDEVLNYFNDVFVKDERKVFPEQLFDVILTGKPSIVQPTAPAVVQTVIIKGNVTATRLFSTKGQIVFVNAYGRKLQWLYHENGKFKREDGRVVLNGEPEKGMRFRLKGPDTFLAKDNKLLIIDNVGKTDSLHVDTYGTLPIYDTNDKHVYWISGGKLSKDNRMPLVNDIIPSRIGNVLQGQTLMWVGDKFGFGMYRAGKININFVFNALGGAINDKVEPLPISGQLVDATCNFSGNNCWFLTTTSQGGKMVNDCWLLDSAGVVKSSAQAIHGDGSWLGSIRGKCSVGDLLLSVTDSGIIRSENKNGSIVQTAEFPDTEPFVDSGCHLFPGSDGIHLVTKQEIYLLKIK